MTTELVTDGDPDYAERLINEQEAASFLGFSVRALQNWRLRGGGPEYVRVSRRSVRYRRRDLIGWADARLEAHTSASPGDNGVAADHGPEPAIEEEPSTGVLGSSEDLTPMEPRPARARRTRTLLPHDRG